MLVRFIKNWALPLAMLAGTLGYFFFADISFVGACQALCEWVSGFPDSAFDFFPTSAHLLQGGGA